MRLGRGIMVARDYLETARLAEATLGYLKQHGLPADPINYAIWFAYAARLEPLLNEAVDGMVRDHGSISADDMVMLHRTFIGGGPFPIRALVGAEPAVITDDVVTAAIDDAAEAARQLDLAYTLATSNQRPSTETLVGRLVAATRIIDQRKRRIEAELAHSRAELDNLQASLDHIRHESRSDQLTTLASRKHFDTVLDEAITEARSEGTPLSLLFTDIDHFKSFNDHYGHQTGDQVLRLVAQSVKQNIRGQDTACRYGGEEFAIILPRTTVEQAAGIGDGIRLAVMGREMLQRSTGEALRRVTISIGIAGFRAVDTAQSLIERADRCLYGAKSGGRNLVVSETDPRGRLTA